ncbi:hypothetical protein ILUMI_21133 [Ignelater luminosus]|uniref:Lipase n=1 Tax=Ignelater luminosus TaxID=2038154 RepID=A0A8K0CGW3_IGNLU|nr:hypothetical protein ILUMI_21133 [Ignelater luminosus]
MFKLALMVWICVLVLQESVRTNIIDEMDLSTVQLIKKNGYPVEIYNNIVTEDGYLLDMYRIPHGKIRKKRKSRNPVLLMHGLLGTSRDYVLTGPEKGLAYFLADRDYDVWLGNARSTIYSKNHLRLNPDTDSDFWDYSFHEIAIYDLPAKFAIIKNVTKKERLSYIGMSQGTTVFYILASMKPEYNNYVNVMVALAPVAYMANFYNPMYRLLAKFEPIWAPLASLIGLHRIPPPPIDQLLVEANRRFCTQEGFFQVICANILFLSGGYDPLQLNLTVVPALYEIKRTASIRQLRHYSQNINSGLFRQFDFGKKVNLEKYGSPKPPAYNLTKVTAPTALFYSEGDWITHALDVETLSEELPNCVYKYKIPYKQFNHYDYLIANDVVSMVYQNVFYVLEKYNKII